MTARARGGDTATRRHSEGAIGALIRALDTEDAHEQRRISHELIAAGAAAVPALAEALASGPPPVRKAASYLLGRVGDENEFAAAALTHAVATDGEPKVRQNAAVSLGHLRSGGKALAEAATREEIDYVRYSLILALGAVGGEAARAALAACEARSEREAETLRKARDRCATVRPSAAWRREATFRPDTWLQVPVGLERIAVEEAAERRVGGLSPIAPGLLRCPIEIAPWDIPPEMRCIDTVLLPGGEGPPFDPSQPTTAATAIASLVGRSALLRFWRDWITCDEDLLPYRVVFDAPHLRRDHQRTLIDAVRTACRPLGLIDRPSNYLVELKIDPASCILVRPCFVPDERFAYRMRDVGAAINPVVAACLARLVRVPHAEVVVDPVCGSGTLLIERARLGGPGHLTGIDVSPTAVAAARANVTAAGLRRRIQIVGSDATRIEAWPACDEVIANLPFGLRTRRADVDLARLYVILLAKLAAALRPGGRAVLVTANRKALRPALTAQAARLEVAEQLRIASGGLALDVWVLTPTAK